MSNSVMKRDRVVTNLRANKKGTLWACPLNASGVRDAVILVSYIRFLSASSRLVIADNPVLRLAALEIRTDDGRHRG